MVVRFEIPEVGQKLKWSVVMAMECLLLLQGHRQQLVGGFFFSTKTRVMGMSGLGWMAKGIVDSAEEEEERRRSCGSCFWKQSWSGHGIRMLQVLRRPCQRCRLLAYKLDLVLTMVSLLPTHVLVILKAGYVLLPLFSSSHHLSSPHHSTLESACGGGGFSHDRYLGVYVLCLNNFIVVIL
jgi:hypothetical protein